MSPNKNEQSALNLISRIKYRNMHMHFEPIDRFDNARCVIECDSVKDQSNPINPYSSNLSSTQPEFKSIIDQLLSFETSKIRINHNVTLTYSVI